MTSFRTYRREIAAILGLWLLLVVLMTFLGTLLILSLPPCEVPSSGTVERAPQFVCIADEDGTLQRCSCSVTVPLSRCRVR